MIDNVRLTLWRMKLLPFKCLPFQVRAQMAAKFMALHGLHKLPMTVYNGTGISKWLETR